MTSIFALALVLTGCTDTSPEAEAARKWRGQVEPLLHENALLAEQVLETGADVYNGTGDAEKIETHWREAVVPTAKHLQHQAELVQAPEAWAARQKTLVETWADRATAYDEVLVALETGDKELWGVGRKRSDEAKLREEKWFKVVNQELAPFDLVLDQFP